MVFCELQMQLYMHDKFASLEIPLSESVQRAYHGLMAVECPVYGPLCNIACSAVIIKCYGSWFVIHLVAAITRRITPHIR